MSSEDNNLPWYVKLVKYFIDRSHDVEREDMDSKVALTIMSEMRQLYRDNTLRKNDMGELMKSYETDCLRVLAVYQKVRTAVISGKGDVQLPSDEEQLKAVRAEANKLVSAIDKKLSEK